MANFFIDRPVFAWVLAISIMVAGALAILQLPIQQYPSVAPPTVTISGTYPGASAQTVENSVTQVIEESMTGLDNLMYMSSSSSDAGGASVRLTFAQGTDVDVAQMQVQNKLALAEPSLPSEVTRQGLSVNKASSSTLVLVALVSNDPDITRQDLADYATSNIKNPLSRINGVGRIQIWGSQYAMRVWLNPEKLTAVGLTPVDVKEAISDQNTEFAVGKLGGQPATEDVGISATIISQTRFTDTKQFEDILLKVNRDGSQVRLKDVARIELAAEDFSSRSYYNGMPAAGLNIQLASGANAVETAEAVKAKMEELSAFFPDYMEYTYPYDITPFITASIDEVVKTMLEAVVLVFLVMYLFLGRIRATFIPAIAIPVVLLGTFGIMAMFGFSINTLTLFGMVLAIGLLVDDAIVVVENVERVMDEDKLPPREATRKSMGQITGALIGIALVLSAVFVPMAFFGGSTGIIYRQFSLTIVSAMALSVVVALTLSPALCATLLKPHTGSEGKRLAFFDRFDSWLEKVTLGYVGKVRTIVNRPLRLLVIYLVIIAAGLVMYNRLPTAFLPAEDQGSMLTFVQLPAGSNLEQTDDTMKWLSDYYLNDSGVEGVFVVSGFSMAGEGDNMGMSFIRLKHWDERGTENSLDAIMDRARAAFSKIKHASIFPVALPPIVELGTANGFDMHLEDRGGLGHTQLMAARNQLLGMAAQDPRLQGVRPNGVEDAPIFRLDLNYEKARALGLSITDINDTLSTAWASSYVNDFIDRGRVKRVYVQSEAEYRMAPDDLNHWYVRNDDGEMVPFSNFATGYWDYGSPKLERYNGVPSLNIQGSPAAGYSTGDAMDAMEELVGRLPAGLGVSWTGISYEERAAGAQSFALYALSMLVVFLSLAALYESWSIPFSVMLVVPVVLLGTLLATTLRGLSNDVYFQVGLLTTIGLSAKNAILVVEFAKSLYDDGMDLVAATIEACRMRLRPILMTSFAFMLGVTPLAISTGAGSASRHAIGTGVIGGMLFSTFIAIFFVPMFYILVMKANLWLQSRRGSAHTSRSVEEANP